MFMKIGRLHENAPRPTKPIFNKNRPESTPDRNPCRKTEGGVRQQDFKAEETRVWLTILRIGSKRGVECFCFKTRLSIEQKDRKSPNMSKGAFMDERTTIHELKRAVADFRDAREWRKYDTPRNLAASISIEAAELLQHFQWKTDMEVDDMIREGRKSDGISDELADVLIYCLGLSDALRIDVSEAVRSKLEKNAKKYPPKLGLVSNPV